MTTPVNIVAPIVAAHIRESRLTINDTAAITHAALRGLRADEVVAHAAQALRDDADVHGLPAAVRHLDAETRRNIARVVLRSVGV